MFAGGAVDFVEEGFEFGGIFAAGAGFDAAGDIDSVGADDADGFADIFGRETAGEDDAIGLRGNAGEVPVGGGACAAEVSGLRGVDQKSGSGTKFRICGRGSSLPQAQSLDDRHLLGNGVDDVRGFVAMELRNGNVQRLTERHDRLRFPIHKNTDGGDKWRQAADQAPRRRRAKAARALRVEIQADGVGAEFGGEFGVFRVW